MEEEQDRVCEICQEPEFVSGIEFEVHLVNGMECLVCSNCERWVDKEE